MGDHPRYDLEKPEKRTFNLHTETDLWDDWKATVPRDVALGTRIRSLIRQDLRAARRDASGTGSEQATVDMLASRVRIRAMQAENALKENDTESAREQIEEIFELADALEA